MSPPLISKAAARYTGAGGKEHCSLCRHFSPRRGGRCARVLGDISPMGWCKLFSREMRGLVADASSFNGGGGGPSLSLDFMTPGVLDPRITFTRASTATYFDSAGVMRNAAINLWLQSADMANAATAKTGLVVAAPTVTANQITAPDGTLTAARVVYPAVTGAGALSAINQNTTSVASAYAFSVYLRGDVGGEQVYLNNNSAGVYNTSPRFTLTTEWQRYVLVTPSLAAGFNHYFAIGADLRNTGVQTATTAQTIFVWGAQLEVGSAATFYIPTTTVANSAPRWDYDPVTLQLRGLLIEEVRTNLLPWSSDPTVDATWLKSGITSAPPTATANQTTAPDGTLTADRVNFPAVSAAGAVSVTQQTLAATAAIHTFSVYLKGAVGGEQTYISIRIGTTPYYTSPRITLTTSWQRYVVTSPANLTTAAWFFAVGTDLRDGTQTSTPAQGIYVWGAQLEVQASATSYIPTTSAAVTRAVDICNVTPLGSWFNASAGTLLFDYDAAKAATVGGFSSGAFANVLYWTLVGNAATANIASAGTVATQTGTVLGAPAKAAVAYTAGRLSLSVNGQATVGNVTLPAGPYPWTNNLAIGTSPWALTGGNMCGHMRAVKYWNTALPDADMRTLTTL